MLGEHRPRSSVQRPEPDITPYPGGRGGSIGRDASPRNSRVTRNFKIEPAECLERFAEISVGSAFVRNAASLPCVEARLRRAARPFLDQAKRARARANRRPMNDYSPAKLSQKWTSHAETLLRGVRNQWNTSRPRKKLLSFSFPEADAKNDQITPLDAKKTLHLCVVESAVLLGWYHDRMPLARARSND
jgi:hypothetical protein